MDHAPSLPGRTDPLGWTIVSYLRRRRNLRITVKSETMASYTMDGALLCRGYGAMAPLERQMLDSCRGRVLDLGAGSGSHSLELQKRGLEVVALEPSPLACSAMVQRGVVDVRMGIWEQFQDGRGFDTIILPMNGWGLAGTKERLPYMVAQLLGLLAPGGRILADSSDISSLYPPQERRGYYQVSYTMVQGKRRSPPFSWLYFEFDWFRKAVEAQGCWTEVLAHDGNRDALIAVDLADC